MHHQNRRKKILAVILTFCLIYVLCRLYSLVNPLKGSSRNIRWESSLKKQAKK